MRDVHASEPRHIRRALISDQRTSITKHAPFGRIKVEFTETGYEPWDARTCYLHFTRGRVDRRTGGR